MSQRHTGESTIMSIMSGSRSANEAALLDMLYGSHTLTSLSADGDSDSYTTHHYQTITTLSRGHESEGLYIYLSKERDIYINPHSLSPDTLTSQPESDTNCGILKNPQSLPAKLTMIEPEPMTQEEWEAIQAQAALDDAADAQALWQKEEAKRLAQERAVAFIAAHRQAHTIPNAAIKNPRRNPPHLVQYESQECRLLADTDATCWRMGHALDSASQVIVQASG